MHTNEQAHVCEHTPTLLSAFYMHTHMCLHAHVFMCTDTCEHARAGMYMHTHTHVCACLSSEEGQTEPELSFQPSALVSVDLESDLNKVERPGVGKAMYVGTGKLERPQQRRTKGRAQGTRGVRPHYTVRSLSLAHPRWRFSRVPGNTTLQP